LLREKEVKMKNYEIIYTLSEEVSYDSPEEAQKESDDFACGIGDSEGLNVVSVKIVEKN
jgi:hypothetical protein